MKTHKSQILNGMVRMVGDFKVNNLLPAGAGRSAGSVFFLDHVFPVNIQHLKSPLPNPKSAHPHRGIATFSYVFSGSLSHYDSKGNHDIISDGGIQWMNAGNGILHNEQPFIREGDNPVFHSLQFWINLPAINKGENAEYAAVQGEDVPQFELPGNSGYLRILLGNYESLVSPLKTFGKEFIFHLHLQPGAEFKFSAHSMDEIAVFVPLDEIVINGTNIGSSKVFLLGNESYEIVLANKNKEAADVLLFGGPPYNEPVFAQGPFVMNSKVELAIAYNDMYNGIFGTIDYLNRKYVSV
jgi:redox-sensitive bicupin YhaK (pirin superfamily)